MPARGYRKGVSDEKVPLERDLRARVPADLHEAFQWKAKGRGETNARLLREILTAYVNDTRLAAPPVRETRRLPDDQMRMLNRMGNNLNQIARQANLMNLHLIEAKALHTLAKLEALVSRLRGHAR